MTRKELLALVYFMQYFRCYLLYTKFIVRTDHAALQWLQGFKNPEGQLARWLEKLQEFNFESMHRKGSEHQNADAISRLPKDSSVTAISNRESKVFTIDGEQTSWIPSYTSQEIRELQEADVTLKPVLSWIKDGKRPPSAEGLPTLVQLYWASWRQLQCDKRTKLL